MSKILQKVKLSENVYKYRIHSPLIAKKRKAGQFIILRPTSDSERIPLTIADSNREEGWIEIIFQVVGRTTTILSSLNEGDDILDLAGPLGKPTHIEKFGKCVCIGGGVGVAPLYPIICSLKEAGNYIVSIIGARTKSLIILEDEIKKQSDKLYVTTDDGSYGKKGFVSDVFKELMSQGEKFDVAYVIGPAIMMKVTSNLTISYGIKTYASLNPIMVDGTGMCGGCRVREFNKTKFACVDGPEFDAAGIDWDELLKRLNTYKTFELQSTEKHACKLKGVV
ncbi:MAG: sulfide/dihydroorotate dehydrogenase-like FAD/NAD-binding protein [Chitinispirillaceae bacterium]|nr:sulfide/dihydroorotate dehydrogenase-like FAD/NAD-binding protein [Chitinispirillaceae bacterium]